MTPHRFNDDLLATPGDEELFAQAYPALSAVFVFPELTALFRSFDQPANAAKARSQKFGYCAVVLGLIALGGASLELCLHAVGVQLGREESVAWIGLVAAVSGILSVALGAWGILYGKAKLEWLRHRFAAERLRQLHFQLISRQLPLVVEGIRDRAALARFHEIRRQHLAQFQLALETKEMGFLGGLEESREAHIWLVPRNEGIIQEKSIGDLEMVLSAYRSLRFQHQLQYASYKLFDPGFGFGSLVGKARVLGVAGSVLILAVFALHLFGAIAIGFPSMGLSAVAAHPWFLVAIPMCAIGALAVRVVADGLSIEREIERYRLYVHGVLNALERFDDSPDLRSKEEAIHEMERLSYHEMNAFLLGALHARYVM